jgi:hypothetical protein
MTEKLYVTTRNPKDRTKFVLGEVRNIVEKKELPNEYKLDDGTVITLYTDVDSINLPIDPINDKYFKGQDGSAIYNIDYHIRIVIQKPKER